MKTVDQRSGAAKFYDLQDFDEDVPFYRDLITSRGTSLLELGCGTGRVILELAELCGSAVGIDLSRAMLDIAEGKVRRLPGDVQRRISLIEADITDFDLGRTFDLVLAPYRVFQALETDEQVAGFFRCLRQHMKPSGSCVLTMFKPLKDPDALRAGWIREEETVEWERWIGDERIVGSDRRPRMDAKRLVLYPELVFRRYRGDELLEELTMPITMRCWYPDQIAELVGDQGLAIVSTWGGYQGEAFGDGNELVLQLSVAT